MRVAFCGKGGSGKSTLSGLFSRYLASQSAPVIVMDGDINQHLGHALGFDDEALKSQTRMGVSPQVLHEYTKGDNPRIASADMMIESTPAGRGSGFIRFSDDNIVSKTYELEKDGIRFLALGGHSDEQVGVTCYHNFTFKMGTYLNHLLDGAGEYFVGDMCAGADPFACSLASKFDIAFLVVEPTEKSVGVYAQCKEYGAPFGTKIYVIGNKIEDEDDLAFIRGHVGDALIGHISHSKFVRKQEKGVFQDITNLEPENLALLETIKSLVDVQTRDWDLYQKNNLHFFEKAAIGWANALYETDLMAHVDPDFKYQDMLVSEQKIAA